MKALDKIKEMAKEMNLGGNELNETVEFFKGRIKDSPSLAQDIENDKKTVKGLQSYLTEQARKGSKGNMAMVGSTTVFEWIEDYFRKEEKEVEVSDKPIAPKTNKTPSKAKSESSKGISKVLNFKPKVVQSSMFDEDFGEEIETDNDIDDDDFWNGLSGDF